MPFVGMVISTSASWFLAIQMLEELHVSLKFEIE
jgi:hypothetical protein